MEAGELAGKVVEEAIEEVGLIRRDESSDIADGHYERR